MPRGVDRFVPEDEVMSEIYEMWADNPPPNFDPMHIRYRLAKHLIGEPPLRDLMKEVGFMVQIRMIELTECIPGFHSSVPLIFDHQHLWDIRNAQELEKALVDLLKNGVPQKKPEEITSGSFESANRSIN